MFQDKRLLGFLIRNLDDCVLVIVVFMLQMFMRREVLRSGKGRRLITKMVMGS